MINIYCVYKIDPIASTRDDTFIIQNALFRAVEITKNADTSKYNYEGYVLMKAELLVKKILTTDETY